MDQLAPLRAAKDLERGPTIETSKLLPRRGVASLAEPAPPAKGTLAGPVATAKRATLFATSFARPAISAARDMAAPVIATAHRAFREQPRVVLLVMAAAFLGCVLVLSSGDEPVAAMDADGAQPLAKLQQLPCWSGSCDNYALEAPLGAVTTLEACDRVGAAFGCHPCKRDVPAQLRTYGGEAAQFYLVCLVKPTPMALVGGVAYVAAAAAPPSSSTQERTMWQLPCNSGSCDNFLLQADAQRLLFRDEVCDYFSRAFGCASRCKRDAALEAAPALAAYLDGGRSNGRITLCTKRPPIGSRQNASGLSYTVAEWDADGAAGGEGDGDDGTDATAADGTAADGSAADGTETEGPEADGAAADGTDVVDESGGKKLADAQGLAAQTSQAAAKGGGGAAGAAEQKDDDEDQEEDGGGDGDDTTDGVSEAAGGESQGEQKTGEGAGEDDEEQDDGQAGEGTESKPKTEGDEDQDEADNEDEQDGTAAAAAAADADE